MAEAVKALPAKIQEIIEVYEWDMRTLEGSRKYFELKAKSLPTIVLDGELVYQALIPGQEELAEEIERRWHQKNSSRK